MTFLSKSVSLPNKFTVPDIGTKNEDFVLGKTFIGLGKQGNLAPFVTTIMLPFGRAKLLTSKKKT